LFKFKEGENFNHRNTLCILRIKLKLHCVQNVEHDPREIGFAFSQGRHRNWAKGGVLHRSPLRSMDEDIFT
jgi:hypothetical protein